MSNGVYRNYAANADGDDRKYALNADGDNRIELSAEQQFALKDALHEQIIEHKISGLTQEIVYVVFHKTIRLNKREDDINGTCFSNLTSTGSRADYVNKHVRELIANSVIISRLGHYGRILSINYNFEQWGQTPEYNRENGGLSSDPEALLKTLHIPKAQEKTEDSDTNPPRENPASNTPTLPDQNRFQNEAEENNSLSVSTLSALIADNIPANLALLITEDIIKQGLQKLIDFVTTLLKDTPIFDLISPLLKSQTPPETPPENTTVTENHAETPVVEKVDKNQSEKPLIECPNPPENKAEPTLKPSVKPAIEQPTTTKTQDYEQLTFPTELKPYEQNQILRVIEKETVSDLDTVQAVLDSMSSRFKVAMEPIKSPIAYFRSLLNSAKSDDFDRSYAEIYQQQCEEKAQQDSQTREKQKSRETIDKHNEAKNNYARLKLYAEHSDKSMHQLAKDLGWLPLLEEMGYTITGS